MRFLEYEKIWYELLTVFSFIAVNTVLYIKRQIFLKLQILLICSKISIEVLEDEVPAQAGIQVVTL